MKKVLVIDGMSCAHCAGHVEEALNALEGVHAKVQLKKNLAQVTLKADVSDEALKNAVAEAGYTVVEIR